MCCLTAVWIWEALQIPPAARYPGEGPALAKKILPELPTENEKEHHLEYLPQTTRETRIGSSAILLNGMGKELRRMMGMVTENVARSYDAVLDPRRRNMAELEDCEEYIDCLNKELAAHISRGIARETNERDSAIISAYFKISSDLERIGDHALNIAQALMPSAFAPAATA